MSLPPVGMYRSPEDENASPFPSRARPKGRPGQSPRGPIDNRPAGCLPANLPHIEAFDAAPPPCYILG
jgi:hypothetical protein